MRPQDVESAVNAGAHALGFVFAPGSPRRLESNVARKLAASVPAFVSRVGLFRDQDAEEVARVLDQVALTDLQFHGSEPPDFCSQFGLPFIKAVSMTQDNALGSAAETFSEAAALLLDSHEPGHPGGTGRVFDWGSVGEVDLPLIIAGGLTPDNVAEAVRTLRPWAVDVSSGVEDSPGIKNRDLMLKFVTEVRNAV